MHFDYRVLSSSGLFGCQGEIEILSIYTNCATINYLHVNNFICEINISYDNTGNSQFSVKLFLSDT